MCRVLLLVLVALVVAIEGRIIIQQSGPSSYTTRVEIGNPPQSLNLGVFFSLERCSVMTKDGQFPFMPFYDFTVALGTFIPHDIGGWDILKFPDGHEFLGFDLTFLNHVHTMFIESIGIKTAGMSGQLGLSHSSRIASEFVLRFREAPVAIPESGGKIVNGYTMDFETSEPSSSAAAVDGLIEKVIPILPSSEAWEFKETLKLNGIQLLGGMKINIELDLQADLVLFSSEIFFAIHMILTSKGHKVKLVVRESSPPVPELLFPCDEEGRITIQPWFDFRIGEQDIRIQVPLMTVSPRLDSGMCRSVIQLEPSGRRNIIGSLALQGRHSILLDGIRKEVRFVDFHPRVPLNAALKPIDGFPVPLLVSHSMNPNSGEDGVIRFSPVQRGFVLRSIVPISFPEGVVDYIFLCAGSANTLCGICHGRVIDGLFHLDSDKRARLDMETREIFLPTRKATDPSLDVYKIAIMSNGKMMTVKLVKVEVTVDFNSLQVEEDEGEIEDFECCICQTEYSDLSKCRISGCTHSFHLNCLRDWTNRKLNCPICRSSIPLKQGAQLRQVKPF
jgi:hypothetical protein